jgi:hypothetical protein
MSTKRMWGLQIHWTKTSMRTWMPSYLVVKFALFVVVVGRNKNGEALADEGNVHEAALYSPPLQSCTYFASSKPSLCTLSILESSHILQERVAMQMGTSCLCRLPWEYLCASENRFRILWMLHCATLYRSYHQQLDLLVTESQMGCIVPE